MATITIRTEYGGSTELTSLLMSPGLISSTSVLLTCDRVLLTHTQPNAVSATTSFVVGSKSVCGINTIGAIPWSIPGLLLRVRQGWSGYSIMLVQSPHC